MNNVEAVYGGSQMLAGPAVAPVTPEATAQQREIIQAVKAINPSELFGQNSELTFVMDRETHRPLVRIVDRKTNEVLMQVPPEYVLRMAQDLQGKK